MKNYKNNLLRALCSLVLICVFSANASACMIVCFGANRDDCYEFEGSCATTCCDCSCQNTEVVHANSNTDYILSAKTGPSYIVHGNVKTRIASDNMAAFMLALNNKYVTVRRADPKVKAAIAANWAEFFKRPDNNIVSAKRLAILSKETGLKIRQK